MGLLIIDHTQGQGLDGKKGQKWEYDTKSCVHCGRMIALLKRPTETLALANIDIGLVTPCAKDLPGEYVHKYRCPKCDSNICRLCAAAMEAAGWTCPGPLEKHIEMARKTGVFVDPAAPLNAFLKS